jgi:hypothetical protein
LIRPEELAKVAAASLIASAWLIASASPATASVTIGQLAPGSPPVGVCNTQSFDMMQPIVTSGAPYVVPGAGTITSWSTSASADAGQKYRMKVFRQVAGLTYMVVGHDGPRDLTAGALNTFPASIPVKRGDVLGINDNDGSAVMNACSSSTTSGDFLSLKRVNLADGESDSFATFGGDRLNVSAVFVPATAQAPAATVQPAAATGQRAAALKKCKHKRSQKKRRKCRRKANKLPV